VTIYCTSCKTDKPTTAFYVMRLAADYLEQHDGMEK